MKLIHEPMELTFILKDNGKGSIDFEGSLHIYPEEVKAFGFNKVSKTLFKLVKCNSRAKDAIHITRNAGSIYTYKNNKAFGETFCLAGFIKVTGIDLDEGESVYIRARRVKK